MTIALYLFRYWKRDPEYIYALIVKRRPIAQPTLYRSALEKCARWINDDKEGAPVEIHE